MDKKYISDNKRVILITGDQTKWYEQAIFIVKKNTCGAFAATDLIAEAESIINNYVGAENTPVAISPPVYSPAAVKKPKPERKRNRRARTAFDTFINTVMVFVSAGFLVLLMYRIFG